MAADTPDTREMYKEIATLIASLAKAFELSDSDVVAALDNNAIVLDFGEDENENRFVRATHGGKTVRIYQGAIKQEPGRPMS